jgi:alpha-beta hydrolase superfamily lysophospholipase
MRLALAALSLLVALPVSAHETREYWGLVRDWQDVTGNRDGIWENEDLAAGQRGWFRGGVEAPSKDELAGFRAWQTAELAKRGVSKIGTTGDEVIEGHALETMARYGRDASSYTDGVDHAGGHDVYWQRWTADHPSGVVTVIVPGYTESTNDWMHVANRLNAAGSTVYVFDPPGQGASSGRRGDADSPEEWKAAYRDVLSRAQAENPGARVVVMAHSTGGGVVADDEHDRVLGQVHGKGPDGLVLSAPYLDLRPNAVNAISGVLSKIPFANRLQVPPLIKLSDDDLGATRLGQWQKATGAKNTLHFIRTMSEMTDRHAQWLKGATGVEIPVAIVQGVDDNVTNPDASRRFVANTPGATFTPVATGSHDLQYDPKGLEALLGAWDRVANGTEVRRSADTATPAWARVTYHTDGFPAGGGQTR